VFHQFPIMYVASCKGSFRRFYFFQFQKADIKHDPDKNFFRHRVDIMRLLDPILKHRGWTPIWRLLLFIYLFVPTTYFMLSDSETSAGVQMEVLLSLVAGLSMVLSPKRSIVVDDNLYNVYYYYLNLSYLIVFNLDISPFRNR
jgi:hypothetical protein